jgi:hypothetical protein
MDYNDKLIIEKIHNSLKKMRLPRIQEYLNVLYSGIPNIYNELIEKKKSYIIIINGDNLKYFTDNDIDIIMLHNKCDELIITLTKYINIYNSYCNIIKELIKNNIHNSDSYYIKIIKHLSKYIYNMFSTYKYTQMEYNKLF